MSLLDDVLRALDRWEEWRRMRAAPDQIEELRQRIAALEEKLGDRRPDDHCPKCGRRSFGVIRYHKALANHPAVRVYKCKHTECGYVEQLELSPPTSRRR